MSYAQVAEYAQKELDSYRRAWQKARTAKQEKLDSEPPENFIQGVS